MREEYDPPEKKIEKFWKTTFRKATEEKMMLKDLTLPLARIKRLMKVEEGVRMVASEVPILFSKIAEKFIEELTFRAWINTEENKRRILQRGDISVAVKTSEMYDFLIYIVPRNDISNAFDRMLSSKMMVENKSMHDRTLFENQQQDRFNLGGSRVGDMHPQQNISHSERTIGLEFPSKSISSLDFNSDRTLEADFPSDGNLSLEFSNEQNSEYSTISRGTSSVLEKPFKDL
ncbi:Nuclear transcription factor Y subunit C-3 [Nosema granulosis]|uniref:Nuclear transcription factor Y subunit C-3 n=1 Tax=Nosema granulosis TaxID=83296 RepID=A0A9P6H0G7_9MICR|nr:Nuclear transcription factor Y subunit C-3 [Nosema granulosis]